MIRRITVYDPSSNPTITDAIINARISIADYKTYFLRNQALTRWLTGGSVTVEDWLGDDWLETAKDNREEVSDGLQNKFGLEIFHHQPPHKSQYSMEAKRWPVEVRGEW